MKDIEEVFLNLMTEEFRDYDRYENDLRIGKKYADDQTRVRKARRSLAVLNMGLALANPDAPDAEIVLAYQKHLRNIIREGERKERKRLKIS